MKIFIIINMIKSYILIFFSILLHGIISNISSCSIHIFYILKMWFLFFVFTFFSYCFYLRLMMKFSFQGQKISIKSFYYIIFSIPSIKLFIFFLFLFLKKIFDNFLLISMKFHFIGLFVYFIRILQYVVMRILVGDIWKIIFEKIILNIVISCKRILKICFIFAFFLFIVFICINQTLE